MIEVVEKLVKVAAKFVFAFRKRLGEVFVIFGYKSRWDASKYPTDSKATTYSSVNSR